MPIKNEHKFGIIPITFSANNSEVLDATLVHVIMKLKDVSI